MPFTYYRKMATKHPESLSAQYNYGSVLLNVGQYSEAIERLELCLELLEGGAGDREADIRYNLGLAYEASELPMPALEQFRVVVSLLPNDVDAAAKLAAILQAHSGPQYANVRGPPEDQLRETAAAWERVLELEPKHHDAHLRLGIACEDGGAPRDALEHYLEAAPLAPAGVVDARFNAARCLSVAPLAAEPDSEAEAEAEGDAAAGEQARAAAEKARKLELEAKASARSEAVIAHLRAALEDLEDDDPRETLDVRNNLAIELSRYAGVAAEQARRARIEKRDDETLYAEMAADARADEAIDQLDAVLRVEPGAGRAHFNVARVLCEHGDWRGPDGALALDALDAATENGYTDTKALESAHPFTRLRDAAATKQRYGEVLNRMSMAEAKRPPG